MNLAATVTMVLMLVLLVGLIIVLSGMEAGLAFIESKVEIRAELHEGVAAGPRRRRSRRELDGAARGGQRDLHQQGAGAGRLPRSARGGAGEPT